MNQMTTKSIGGTLKLNKLLDIRIVQLEDAIVVESFACSECSHTFCIALVS
jgi:hypothetical protein